MEKKKKNSSIVEIRKYANRRLYDTSQSRYVTLADVAKMIREGKDVLVVDAKTREDLTKAVMLQIISESKPDQEAIPIDFLRRIIRAGNKSVRQSIKEYLQMGFQVQQGLQKQLGRMLRTGWMLNPFLAPWLVKQGDPSPQNPEQWLWPLDREATEEWQDEDSPTFAETSSSTEEHSVTEEKSEAFASQETQKTPAPKEAPPPKKARPPAKKPPLPSEESTGEETNEPPETGQLSEAGRGSREGEASSPEVERELEQLRQQLFAMQQTIEKLSSGGGAEK